MNLRVALRWLWHKRLTAGANRCDVFDQPDPEPTEDIVDWLYGNDTVVDQRHTEQRLTLLTEAGGEVG